MIRSKKVPSRLFIRALFPDVTAEWKLFAYNIGNHFLQRYLIIAL